MSETFVLPGPAAAGVDLKRHNALVTGAASGIGRACTERLAQAGAAVTVLDLNGEAAKEVAVEIGAEAMQADLSDYEVLDELNIDADIVVNNAGLQHVAAIEEFPPELFSLMLRIMLEAPFRIVRMALPKMYEKGWGRVINLSSVPCTVSDSRCSIHTGTGTLWYLMTSAAIRSAALVTLIPLLVGNSEQSTTGASPMAWSPSPGK